jgi:hypothetical protein
MTSSDRYLRLQLGLSASQRPCMTKCEAEQNRCRATSEMTMFGQNIHDTRCGYSAAMSATAVRLFQTLHR